MNKITKNLKGKKRYLLIIGAVLIVSLGLLVFFIKSKPVILNSVIEFEYKSIMDNPNVIKAKVVDKSNKNYDAIEIIDWQDVFDTNHAFRIDDTALQMMKEKNMSEEAIKAVIAQFQDKSTFSSWAQTFSGWADFQYEYTAEISIKANGTTKVYSVNYMVLDTQAPILEGVRDLETDYGKVPDFKQEFSAKDIVDGPLEVQISGDVSYDKAGSYELIAYANDVNGNRTEKHFKLVVNEDVVVAEDDTSTGDFHNSLVFMDPIIVNVQGPLGIGRIINLKESGLENETITIAYKTQSKAVTLFMTEDIFTLEDLLFDNENACNEFGDDAFYRYPDKHLGYECKSLASGRYGITLITGTGFPSAYVKDPVSDTIIININGVKTEHVITYHRRYVGSYLDLIDEFGSQ